MWIRLDRHPNIVRAYWVEEIASRHYIVLEYIAHDEHGRNPLTLWFIFKAFLHEDSRSTAWGVGQAGPFKNYSRVDRTGL